MQRTATSQASTAPPRAAEAHTAKLLDGNTVDVDGKRITAGSLVIATGSSPIQILGFSYADGPVIDSTGALALKTIPKRMVVIGGGYIGLEMTGVYAKLGTHVTVVEMMDRWISSTSKSTSPRACTAPCPGWTSSPSTRAGRPTAARPS